MTYPPQGWTYVPAPPQPNTATVLVAWAVTLLSLGYMFPWAVAASRGKSNAGAIGLLNLLLAWTLIGWVVALVMACGAHQQQMVAVPIGGPPPPPDGAVPAWPTRP